MTGHWRLSLLITVSSLAGACGGGTPVPTSPTTQQSFLTGTWTGTLSIDREPMLDRSRTPSISVTIGRRECLYDAFITTAPAKLDLPATITLLADTLLELSCYAENPFSLDTTRSRYAARLVLVDNLQSDWQCAKYEGNGHLLIAADPRMADFNTLQQLLWRLLLTASLNQVAA